jgi:predicted dehydrogenase
MSRLRIGIIGCGAIAQIQYLPLLREMAGEFAIAGLSDLSADVLARLGDVYGVSPDRRFQDYHDLVASDVEAVVVCNSGSHAPPSIAAAEAGKHVLVEKPICTTPGEAEAMVAAADGAGVTMMVAYMKRHDPAFRYAQARVREMTAPRFAQVNHLHPDNSLHLAEFNLVRARDLSPSLRSEMEAAYDQAVSSLLGYPTPADMPADVKQAFFWVHNSMIHDLGNLHGLFGPPEAVVSTEVWADGAGITTTLAYPGGLRAVCTWVDLPVLPAFEETLAVYGSRERVIVSFPTGFSKGMPSIVTIQGMEPDQPPWRKELSWHDNPFALELRHLKHCVETGARPLTDGRDAVADIALVRDILRAYIDPSSSAGGQRR